MRKHKQVCKLLLEGDSYFNGKDVNTNEFNKHSTIKSYCRGDDCKTNEERINALTIYIFKEFKDSSSRKSKYNDYDECFLLWLSDKLFKIHLESIGKKDVINYMDGTTLNQAYEKHLKNHKVKLDHWDLFDMIKGLKEANLKYMSEFYKLLNLICKLITDYYNGAQTKQLYKYPADCSLQYKNLYRNIYECKPYLNLLNKLKGIYDDFSSVIKKNGSNNELASKLKKLTPQGGKEMEAVRGFKKYDINNTKCKFPKKKNTKPKKPDTSSLQPSNQLKGRQQETSPTQKPVTKEPKLQSSPESAPPSPQEPQRETQQSSSTTPPEDPPTKPELPSSSQESQELGKNNQNELTDSGKEPDDPSGGKGSQLNGGDRANSESGGVDTEQGGPEDGSADKVSETVDPGKGKGGSKGGTGDVSGGDQGSPDGGTKGTKSVQGGLPDVQISNDSQDGANTNQQGTSGGSGSNTGNQGGDTGGDKGSQDGSGDSETGSGSEQKPTDSDPGEKETQNTPGTFFDIKPYMFRITLKGMEQINNAFKSINENMEKITKAIDNINSLYNTSVSNIKNTFNKFTEFFNNFNNNPSIDSKKVESSPDSDDNKSGSDGTGDDPPTPNDPSQSQKDQHKQDLPQQNSHQTSSDISQTPKDPQIPPTPQTTENSKEQTQVQKSSQDPSGNQNSDRTDHGSQKLVPDPV
ncbi:Plasmodium variant antigen protein Cir/Yir/Bir, putative, partial [Plasmodium chabaudi adami]